MLNVRVPCHTHAHRREKEEARFLTLAHTRVLLGTSPANYEHQTTANTTSFGRQVCGSGTYVISLSVC
jgi:hypothetical protein